MFPTRTELAQHLTQLVETRLLSSLAILVGDHAVTALTERVSAQAQQWARALCEGTTQDATACTMRLIAALYPNDETFDPPADWWHTPLGQAVAHRVGHPTAPAISYGTAGAMLGISRQGVHDLITRGKLHRHPDGGATTASVRDRLQQRRDDHQEHTWTAQ